MFLSILAFSTLVHCVATHPFVGPVVLPFNRTHFFGYDGPWQAIPMQIGQPIQQADRPIQQLVNLYPGGTSSSVLPSNDVASEREVFSSEDFTSIAGVYNASLPDPATEGSSENFAFAPPGETGLTETIDGGWAGSDPSRLKGRGLMITDTVSFQTFNGWFSNVSLLAVYEAKYNLPDGRQIPLDVGFLSLGAQTHRFAGEYIGRMVPLDLSTYGASESNTWGLHIGSVDHKIPGSLVFGGYDRARVIGDVNTASSQDGNGNMFMNLLDISIGVARGGSPFPFQEKSGLLRHIQNNTQTIQTRPNPTVPYLYLPENTCRTIAAHLPVTYLPSLDLYAWNTDSPQYTAIVSSPAYLAFIFQRGEALDNLTIRVPFALLNLTLTPPLVNTATPYFPCKSFAPPKSPHYHLGRAFLQAAFIGMNWHNSKWWMAQAPGPQALPSNITSLQNSSETITAIAGQSLWASSWDGFWTPLPGGLNSSSDGPNLSRGAKAGIAIGALAGAATALGAAFLLLRRRRRNLNKAASSNRSQNPLTAGPHTTHQDDPHASQLMLKPELPVPSADEQPASGQWAASPPVQPDTVHELPAQGQISHELSPGNARMAIRTNTRTKTM